MENSLKELSAYRYSKALEDIKASEVMLKECIYKASINRSYYAIFHAMHSITVLKEFDSSKHSGVIAFFNQNYVKTGVFEKSASKIIRGASLIRENQIIKILCDPTGSSFELLRRQSPHLLGVFLSVGAF